MSNGVSIRKRLIWYVLATIIVMSVVTGLSVYQGTTHEADEIFDAALVQTARILDGIMTREAIEANRSHLQKALERAVKIKKKNKDEDDDDEDSHAYEKKIFFIISDSNEGILLKSNFAPTLDISNPKTGFDEVVKKNKTWILSGKFNFHTEPRKILPQSILDNIIK